MILTQQELDWVAERMKVYNIKYQEIYNEVLDHVITAIEVKRGEGDKREILSVFQDVIDTHFGGYMGIEDLAAGQENLYNTHVRKQFRHILASYFNWRVLLFTAVVVGLTFNLPDFKLMHNLLLIFIFVMAISPVVYTFITIYSKVKIAKGKRSLLKTHLITQAYFPAMLLNGALYLPTIFFLSDDETSGFRLYGHLPLPVLMVVLIFFMLLNLSVIRVCNQMIKKETT